jgi:hypothetical protein
MSQHAANVAARTQHVAIDSQCYTYLIDALASAQEPTDNLAAQRLALFRSFLYRAGGLHITPTTRTEFEAIRDAERRRCHQDWTTLFPETNLISNNSTTQRTQELGVYHDGTNDCRIVAEVEDASILTLITFDRRLMTRLASHTQVAIVSPTDYWNGLSVPRGATPVMQPRADNPMATQTWWRW